MYSPKSKKFRKRCQKVIITGEGEKLAVTNQREFHVTNERGEDGYYVASVVELSGCHTQARSLNELDKRIKEVIEVYLEAEGKDLRIPNFVMLKKVRV